MATFSKTRALFSSKYIAKGGMDLPKLSQKLVRMHSSAFDLEEYPQKC